METIKNYLSSLRLKFLKFILPEYKCDPKEQLLEEILSLLLFSDSNTECITAPVSGIYYISNPKLGYWMRVWDDGVTITNHTFSYSHSGNYKYQKRLIEKIHVFMENDRALFEQTVFTNEVELLKQIKEKIIYG
jgi:hypothetical protein